LIAILFCFRDRDLLDEISKTVFGHVYIINVLSIECAVACALSPSM
jgi:hypothetical protein